MTKTVNEREIVLGILMETVENGQYSHIVLRDVLAKYQYLSKQERAFITRVSEGTLEHLIEIDYILDQFSKVKVKKMKPVIRNILRSAVYQLKYMDSVPDRAVCSEAVNLAVRKGFSGLRGYVNGVLRSTARGLDDIGYPEEGTRALSVKYSCPEWIIELWKQSLGSDVIETMLAEFQREKPITVRCCLNRITPDEFRKIMKEEGVKAEPNPYLPYAFSLSGYDYLESMDSFRGGLFMVQDVSSMLAGEIAAVKEGDYVIDLCAAPGGKALYLADKLHGTGRVDARDLSQTKTDLIRDNALRQNFLNVVVTEKDATQLDRESLEKADIVLADVPCSGLGVMGKKKDIKYKLNQGKIRDLVGLQRKILEQASTYVKPGGTLIYSTCTIGKEENIENVQWFTEHYPYELESLDPYLCEELRGETTAQGYLQLLPGIHKCDGFFMARLKRKNEWNS